MGGGTWRGGVGAPVDGWFTRGALTAATGADPWTPGDRSRAVRPQPLDDLAGRLRAAATRVRAAGDAAQQGASLVAQGASVAEPLGVVVGSDGAVTPVRLDAAGLTSAAEQVTGLAADLRRTAVLVGEALATLDADVRSAREGARREVVRLGALLAPADLPSVLTPYVATAYAATVAGDVAVRGLTVAHDERLAVRLAALQAIGFDLPATPGGPDLPVPPATRLPPPDTSPAVVAAWWAGLAPVQRAWLVQQVPDGLRALRGLPAEVLDRLHRTALAADVTRAEVEVAGLVRLRAVLPSGSVAAGSVVVLLVAALVRRDRLLAVVRAVGTGPSGAVPPASGPLPNGPPSSGPTTNGLPVGPGSSPAAPPGPTPSGGAPPGGPAGGRTPPGAVPSAGAAGRPRRYLLEYDAAGDGTAVIAVGDPDTADDVAVVVPGTGSDLGTTPGQVLRGTALYDQMGVADPSGRHAVVVYQGYDSPDTLATAVDPRPAVDAAPELGADVDGWVAANVQADGTDPHVTVIGHSYGSLVVGDALAAGHLDAADDVVAVGSPGLGPAGPDALGVADGHLWVGAADGDLVPAAGVLAPGVFGPPPAADGYGATVFDTGGAHGHSQYFRRGTESLANLAEIAVGDPEDVTTR